MYHLNYSEKSNQKGLKGGYNLPGTTLIGKRDGGIEQNGQRFYHEKLYYSITDIAAWLNVDYNLARRTLIEKTKNGEVKKSGHRYNIKQFFQSTYTSTNPLVSETIRFGVLGLKEVHETICKEVGSIHYKSLARKVRLAQIPSYKIGSTYRVPKYILDEYIKDGKITIRNVKPTVNHQAPARDVMINILGGILDEENQSSKRSISPYDGPYAGNPRGTIDSVWEEHQRST